MLSTCVTMCMLSSMGWPSSLTKIGITRFPTNPTVVSVSSSRTTVSCKMQPLERGRHPHAETKRAVLEHKEPHDTRSFLDVPFEERAMGRQEPGAPRQQFSVRKAMSPFIAS